jgi:hypothetical protein
MNHGKLPRPMTKTTPWINPPQPAAVPAEPKARSRHAAITHDLYSYRRYKNWMDNLRATWDKT